MPITVVSRARQVNLNGFPGIAEPVKCFPGLAEPVKLFLRARRAREMTRKSCNRLFMGFSRREMPIKVAEKPLKVRANRFPGLAEPVKIFSRARRAREIVFQGSPSPWKDAEIGDSRSDEIH